MELVLGVPEEQAWQFPGSCLCCIQSLPLSSVDLWGKGCPLLVSESPEHISVLVGIYLS